MATREELEQEFMVMMATANRHERLCIMALLFAAKRQDHARPEGYSNGELKKAIKHLRIVQRDNPDMAEDYTPAITLIRNNWLHKAA